MTSATQDVAVAERGRDGGRAGRVARPRARAVWIIAGALLLAHAAMAWFTRQVLIQSGQDDAWYVLLARSLRQLRYVDLMTAGQPVHHLYAPGYPGGLALWSLIGGENVEWLIALSVLCSVAVLGVAFLAWRRVLDERLALLALAMLAFNPALVHRAGVLGSEPLFALLTITSLYVAMPPEEVRNRWAAGVLAVLGALTRPVGVALLGSLSVHWVLQRRWRAAALLLAGSAVTVGVWLFWTAVSPDQYVGKSYVADATVMRGSPSIRFTLVRRAVRGVRFYAARALPNALDAPTIAGTPVDNAMIVGLLALGLALGLVALWRSWRPAALYLVLYGAILLAWPFRVERFLYPLLPLIVPTLLLGWSMPLRRLGRAWSVGALAAAAAVLIMTGFTDTLQRARVQAGCERGGGMPAPDCLTEDQASFFEALRFVGARLPEDAIIAAAKSAPLHYYTGRNAPPVGAVMNQSDSTFIPYLRATQTRYVLLGRLHVMEATFLAPLVLENCRALDLEAYFPPATYLLRVMGPEEVSARQPSCEAVAGYRTKWRD